jgi:carotenoid cleavage dioxygenase-like enzyme
MYSEFATDPCRSLFARAMAVFNPDVTDSAKVNIAKLADHFVALAETPIQIEFDPITLKSVGVAAWDSSNFGRMTTVHPQIDEANNEAFNLVTRYGALSSYCFRKIDVQQGIASAQDLTTLRSLQPAYIHSFGMTRNYLVLVEYPLVVNPLSLLLWLKPYIENFTWKPELGTKFHVFQKSDGKHVRTLTSDAFFSFHHVNAFERDGYIHIDMVAYDNSEIINAFYLHRLEDPQISIPAGLLKRFSLSLEGSGQVSTQTLSSVTLELPSIDYAEKNTSESLSFVYGIGNRSETGFYDQLVKIDVRDATFKVWFESGCYPGEAVFVGRPGRQSEDDGVLLSVVLDAEKGTSFLLVLDAHDFKEIARASLSHPILFGYHGIFT